MNKSVVIFSGGTGGHVIPSVAFGNYLITKGYNCVLITDERGFKYTSNYQGQIKKIKASHISGGILFNIFAIFKLFYGFFNSVFILIKLKPIIAVSFGSYASLPPCLALNLYKKFNKVNFFIHEQNSVIGRTNKFLFNYADMVFVNYDKNYNIKLKYKKKIKVVGMPIIDKISINLNYNLILKNDKKYKIFIYGGSQGSIQIIKCFEKLLEKFKFDDLKNFYFFIQCPDSYANNLKHNIKKYNLNFEIKNFFYDLPTIMQNIDIVLSRCGAGTINDIILFKIPSILIPLPGSKDNHQYENANFLYKKNCCIILNQDKFDEEIAYNYIMKILKNNNIKNEIKDKLKNEISKDTNEVMMKEIINALSK